MDLPVTIAFAQRKGGVGKTTLAISVAAELTQRGHSTLLVDADPQRSACAWAELGKLPFTVWEVPCDERTEGYWEEQFRMLQADYLIIDAAPSEICLRNVARVADLIVVPCTPSGIDIAATRMTLSIIDVERERRGSDLPVILVPNRLQSRTLESMQISGVLDGLGEWVSAGVSSRTSFVRAFLEGQAVCQYEPQGVADREISNLTSFIILHAF
jgi:chromosome partitioning protein